MSCHKAPTVAGSASSARQASKVQLQSAQEEGPWSLLSKMYGSQMLSYMVAIDDAKAIMDRMRHMRPGPSLHSPNEVQSMNIWQVLQGTVQQQRVWTFGKQQVPAEALTSAMPRSIGAADDVAKQNAKLPCISSSEPVSIKNGVKFISCSAGPYHSAAVAEGGYIFTWGSNDKGQLGCDTSAQAPIAVHVLPPVPGDQTTAATTISTTTGHTAMVGGCNKSSALGTVDKDTAGSVGTVSAALTRPETAVPSTAPKGSRVCQRSESLIALAGTLKLPNSLVNVLAQQQHKQQQQLADDAQLESLMQLEAQSQQLHGAGQIANGDHAVCHAYVPSESTSTALACNGQPQQHGQRLGQQDNMHDKHTLLIYRLHVGQAVRMVACGGQHTLAALSSSGLVAWGLNDKGQLGVPALIYKQVQQPMRVHGFNGQRLVCISAGNKHSAAVYDGGTVCTWGHGRFGRLGVGGCPDILPPSIVGSLRGCTATQVACGTAHTLVLTADGKVYAWGYNGQGALGTGDEQDRLVPTLVPGLPLCTQVAAAASSMALSCTGEVYQWGGAAYISSARCRRTADGTLSRQQKVTELGAPAATTAPVATDTTVIAAEKNPLPWLQGIHVGQVACGIENAAAVSLDGQLVLWGCKQNMTRVMLQQAQALATNTGRAHIACAVPVGVHDAQQSQQASAAAAMHSTSNHNSGCIQVSSNGQLVKSRLIVDQNGCIRVSLSVLDAVYQDRAIAELADVPTPPQTSAHAADRNKVVQTSSAASPETAFKDPLHGSESGQDMAQSYSPPHFKDQSMLDLDEEPVKEVSCGAAHHVMLCQPSEYTPTIDELRAAVLALVQAYIRSYLSRATSSLNALMQQDAMAKQEAENNGAGEEGSVAHSALSRKSRLRKPAGSIVGGYAAGSGSYVASAPARNTALDVGACAQPDLQDTAAAEVGTSALPPLFERKASSLRHSAVAFATEHCSVSTNGSVAAGDDASGRTRSPAHLAGTYPVAPADTAVHQPGYAASMIRGAGGSVYARSVGKTGGAASTSGAPAAGVEPCAAADGPEELSLHGVMLLCREVGLVDNITEHLDIIKYFELVLHRKRGRLGPSYSRPGSPGPVEISATQKAGAGDSSSSVIQQQQGQAVEQQQLQRMNDSAGGVGGKSDSIRVVHVVRPGQAIKAVTAAEAEASSAPTDPRASSSEAVRSRPSTAAAGTLVYESLNADEVLELLMMVMKERHPRYRRQPDVLLRLLAGWHMARLQGRKSDRGPPWLLRQMLQPQLLYLLESAANSEMLHGIYIHLAGSSRNPNDLSMSLTDIKRGLKHAAGYRTLQESCTSTSSKQSSCEAGQGNNRSNSKRGFQASTESSRGKNCAPCSTVGQHDDNGAVEPRSFSKTGNSPVKTFHLPLYKVAAFLRSAKLLPRLLDKYIAQLQRIGEERRERSALMGLPIMPMLKASVGLAHAGELKVAAQTGHRRRLVAKSDTMSSAVSQGRPSQQQDRLAQLPESSSVQTSASGSSKLQQLGGGQAADAETQDTASCTSISLGVGNHDAAQLMLHRNVSSRHHVSTSGQRLLQSKYSARSVYRCSESSSTSGAACDGIKPAGDCSLKLGVPGNLESVEDGQEPHADLTSRSGPRLTSGAGGSQGMGTSRSLGPSARPEDMFRRSAAIETVMAEGGVIDAAVLDSVELGPVRAKAASIIVQGPGSQPGTRAGHAGGQRTAKGASMQLVLQLPSPRSHAVSTGCGHVAAQQQQQGDAVWDKLVKTHLALPQQQQQSRSAPVPTARKQQGKGTYQQQQAVLKRKRLSAEAEAKIANELEQIRRDTWIVFMLVELLGSYLITPPWTAKVKLTDTNNSAAACANTDDECSGNSSACCSWNHGYVYGAEDASSSNGSQEGNGWQAREGSSSTGGGLSRKLGRASVDIMHHCISYPQFVEVLLCLLGARATVLLEPEVKQLRNIAADGEMQEHAKVMLDCIRSWRADQLSPCKADIASADPAGAAVTTDLTDGGTPENPGPIAHLYCMYSSMEIGTTCLALRKEGFLKLLADARITGKDDSAVTPAEAAVLFDDLGTCCTNAVSSANNRASKQQVQPYEACDSNSQAANDLAGLASRPVFSPTHRQSTFMRCVTSQLLHKLEQQTDTGSSTAAVEQQAQQSAHWTPASAASQQQKQADKLGRDGVTGQAHGKLGTSGSCCSEMSIFNDDQEPMQQSADFFERHGSTQGGTLVDAKIEEALKQWQSQTESRTAHQDNIAVDVTPEQAAEATLTVLYGVSEAGVVSRARLPGGNRLQTLEADDACVLTLNRFQQAMTMLSRKCFPRIANKVRAWQLLLHKHIQPLADKTHSRFDVYYGSLATPGIMALLTAWQSDLQQLFDSAVCKQSMQQGHSKPSSSMGRSEHMQPPPQHLQLPLISFMELLQDRGAIPQLLEPADVQHVLRRVMLQRLGHQNTVFTSLDCKCFGHALAMCGLASFGSRKLQASPLRQSEQQLAAFLTHLGLPPLPGQQEMLSGVMTQPDAGGKPSEVKGHSSMGVDPYMEWWSLEFDPAAENRQHDHLSTLSYMPVMIQEHVTPPQCCPASVLHILSAAQTCHQQRQIDDALRLYAEAEHVWRQQVSVQDSATGDLPSTVVLYLSAAVSGCLVTGGRDEEGWEVLVNCADVLSDLHEAGADTAVWHAAAGVALYHCGNLQAAFEHCVRGYVIRNECRPLGPTHPDTAAAAHNLGVVLDCLGKSSRALQLVEQAQSVFNRCLGPSHPRTLIAARNVQHIKHKIIKLPAEPQELLSSAADAPAASSALGRQRARQRVKAAAVAVDSEQASTEPRGKPRHSSSSDTSDDFAEAGDGGNGTNPELGSRPAPGNQHRKGSRNSMQERLQAVQNKRMGVSNSASRSRNKQVIDAREYTDPDHLGAGVFKASCEQKQLYDAMKPDIAAHAQAVDNNRQEQPMVEMQVVHFAELPRQAAATALTNATGAVVDPELAGDGGSLIPPRRNIVEQVARKGPLLDATVTAVKKPLSVQEARKLRRRQQQARNQSSSLSDAANKQPGLGASLLDKLF